MGPTSHRRDIALLWPYRRRLLERVDGRRGRALAGRPVTVISPYAPRRQG
jgi:hypothetical protein